MRSENDEHHGSAHLKCPPAAATWYVLRDRWHLLEPCTRQPHSRDAGAAGAPPRGTHRSPPLPFSHSLPLTSLRVPCRRPVFPLIALQQSAVALTAVSTRPRHSPPACPPPLWPSSPAAWSSCLLSSQWSPLCILPPIASAQRTAPLLHTPLPLRPLRPLRPRPTFRCRPSRIPSSPSRPGAAEFASGTRASSNAFALSLSMGSRTTPTSIRHCA